MINDFIEILSFGLEPLQALLFWFLIRFVVYDVFMFVRKKLRSFKND